MLLFAENTGEAVFKELRLACLLLSFLAGTSSLLAAGVERLDCIPRLPVFCGNLHIACSGRSNIPTKRFSVVLQDSQASVLFEDGKYWDVRFNSSRGDRVLPSPSGPDWIRIDSRNLFSHRIYRKGKALMSVGECRLSMEN